MGRPAFKAVEKCLRQAMAVIESSRSADASPESVLSTLKQKLERAVLAEVVLRESATPDQVRDRANADGFRIKGDIYLKPDRLRAWLPSKTDRALLKVSGSPPPPCNARLDRHDVAHIRDVESHIWLTI